MESNDLPKDTSRTDGRRRKPKHLCLPSSKPDISLIFDLVLEGRRVLWNLPIRISPREQESKHDTIRQRCFLPFKRGHTIPT